MIRGFQVQNWKGKVVGFPIEDSFKINHERGIIAVADGVTMDCVNGGAVRKSLGGAYDIFFHYPRPSPAKQTADLFTSEATEYIKNYLDNVEFYEDLKRLPIGRLIKDVAFHDVNFKIKILNEERGVDYSKIDYAHNYPAGCTAALVYSKNGDVHWGYTTDCGVAILSHNGDLKEKTKDEGPGKVGDKAKEAADAERWTNLEGRALTRKKFRNNPSESSAVGILNGMSEAMSYVRTGVFAKGTQDYTLVYTDGISEILFKEDGDIKSEFAELFKKDNTKDLEELCRKKVLSEGTLVVGR